MSIALGKHTRYSVKRIIYFTFSIVLELGSISFQIYSKFVPFSFHNRRPTSHHYSKDTYSLSMQTNQTRRKKSSKVWTNYILDTYSVVEAKNNVCYSFYYRKDYVRKVPIWLLLRAFCLLQRGRDQRSNSKIPPAAFQDSKCNNQQILKFHWRLSEN